MGYPCRIIPINLVDRSTLTCSIAALTNTSVDNLKNNRRKRNLRWISASGMQTIKGTFGGDGFHAGILGLKGFNFFPDAIIRQRGYASSDWTGTAIIDTGNFAPYASGVLATWPWTDVPPTAGDGVDGTLSVIKWNTDQQIGSWQIDITDTNNSYGYSELSRVVIGQVLTTTANARFGAQGGYTDTTTQEDMDGGSLLSESRYPRKTVRGTLAGATAAERTVIHNMLGYVGKSRTFAISFQATEGGDLEKDFTLLQAKFTELPLMEWMETQRHSMPFALVEA